MIYRKYVVAQTQNDKIKFTFDYCNFGCNIFREEKDLSLSVGGSDVCSLSNNEVDFGLNIEYYRLKCLKMPDFYYFMQSTFIQQNTPVLKNFYFRLSKSNDDLTITLFEDQHTDDICRFEYSNATSGSNNNNFPSKCDNNDKCFYTTCTKHTFKGINSSIKAVKIRILKHGMTPLDENNYPVYICIFIFIKFY